MHFYFHMNAPDNRVCKQFRTWSFAWKPLLMWELWAEAEVQTREFQLDEEEEEEEEEEEVEIKNNWYTAMTYICDMILLAELCLLLKKEKIIATL